MSASFNSDFVVTASKFGDKLLEFLRFRYDPGGGYLIEVILDVPLIMGGFSPEVLYIWVCFNLDSG